MDSKHRELIREAIKRPLPKGSVSTADIAVGMMSSTKLAVTVQEITEIVNEMVIAELLNAEVAMADASREEITEYRNERISDIVSDPHNKWRWYCPTCGKIMLSTVNEFIPEDDRYCECE